MNRWRRIVRWLIRRVLFWLNPYEARRVYLLLTGWTA